MNREIEVIARAIITDPSERKMLFCAPKNREYFYLPGGHVEFLEKAEVALQREILEETGIKTDIENFVFAGASEEMFIQRDENKHEINIYFKIPYAAEMKDIETKEDHIVFEWLPVSDLHALPILPPSAKNIAQENDIFWNIKAQ